MKLERQVLTVKIWTKCGQAKTMKWTRSLIKYFFVAFGSYSHRSGGRKLVTKKYLVRERIHFIRFLQYFIYFIKENTVFSRLTLNRHIGWHMTLLSLFFVFNRAKSTNQAKRPPSQIFRYSIVKKRIKQESNRSPSLWSSPCYLWIFVSKYIFDHFHSRLSPSTLAK